MPLPLLKNIFSGTAKEVIATVGNVIDNLTTSKEEKEAAKLAFTQELNRHLEALEASTLKELELYNADRDSARDMNSKIQESEKASWLAKNVAYILDLTITTAVYVLVGMIAFVIIPEENKELFYMVIGVLLAKWGDIVSFHRGTSKGSEDKAKTLDRITRR